ncbi:sensor histidine kinase [Legionella taurinensis]|uniref:sensor histidine kinase n=1 Tax=Legionella taurinensis TaxID=70611 RepID=UPI00299F3A1A|nr:ATP-binding protein [Legionella taurinensis]MDX1837002.1 ATP-binding protein [Legionella taurinensis]
MELHKLLYRQLNRTECKVDAPPKDIRHWEEFLSRINKTYQEADMERYMLERSMDLSSREMMMLNQRLENAQKIAKLCYWHYDYETQHVTWSKEIYNLAALPVGHNSRDDFMAIVHPDDRDKLLELVDRAIHERINYEYDMRVLNNEGQYGWFRTVAHCLEDPLKLAGVLIDVTGSKKAEAKIKELNQKLLVSARRAGMSEIATFILHNIGNVLNSLNISLGSLKESMEQPYFEKLKKITALIEENRHNLSKFLTEDEKGRLIPDYLVALSDMIRKQNESNQDELVSIENNLQHIKDIVAMQQTFGGVSGVDERVLLSEQLETTLQMLVHPHKDKVLTIHKQFIPGAYVVTDRSKLLQILINLVQNAKESVYSNTNEQEKKVELIIEKDQDNYVVRVIDNGDGILPENLNRIFSFGFTTKKDGHGFGLHSSAIAAQNIGGSLAARSDGPGKGAEFILKLPIKRAQDGAIFNE